MKRIVGAVLLLAATATACADSKVESPSGSAASPTPVETLEPTFDPPLEDAIDEGPLSERLPEEWRVTVEDALAEAAFKVILPNHPSASRDNVETVYLTPGRTLVLMQFPRPEAPDEPVRREHLEVAEEVWQYSSEPKKVWEESIENAPLPAKSLYAIDGVVALGVQAHSSKDATSSAFLQFGLNGLDVQISGGESLDLLIEIARSMISQAPK